MTERGSFVAIRAEPNSHEMFHVMMVQDKHIAKENIKDASEEHCILKGEPYLVGKLFSFQKESRKFSCFKEWKNTEFALIHIQEVFLTNLEINDNHQMVIANYRMHITNHWLIDYHFQWTLFMYLINYFLLISSPLFMYFISFIYEYYYRFCVVNDLLILVLKHFGSC